KASGGLPFVFLFGLVSCAAAAPWGYASWRQLDAAPSAALWGAIVASGLLHVVYSLVLQQGYRAADFSIVYPLARGTGPLFSVCGAVLLLGEAPTAAAWLGVAAIVGGIFLIAAAPAALLHGRRTGAGLFWGLLTGLFIASYTVVDGWAIKTLAAPPLFYYAAGLAVRTVLLAPFALRAPAALARTWRCDRLPVLGVGLLSPLAYSLVLLALTRAPLSHVAPVRELAMLAGVLIGARLLRESLSPQRLAGCACMVAGAVLLVVAP
ncbi:MAG: EamA family transporter, partial [Rhodocyclaceae bacterium]|nr:EamA family transporter [Rhodocyclaceae bacterium]